MLFRSPLIFLLFFLFLDTQAMTMANPASEHCIKAGGVLTILKRGDGGEYAVCFFTDNRKCEEWALYRGDCPVGGLKVTGYTTPEQVYCVIQGGKILAIEDGSHAKCEFPNQFSCDLSEFFNGQCKKKSD